MRIVQFADGAQSETTPTIGNISASNLVSYPDDASYEADNIGSPFAGNIYYNTTDNLPRYYNGSQWIYLVDEETTQELANKTITNSDIDADQNNVSNIEDSNIKAGAAIDATKLGTGNVSNTELDYLDGATSNIQDQLDNKQDTAEKDQPNGYAGLDANGRISESALPITALIYRGNWDADTNSPALADGVGTTGDVYRVSVAGSQDLGSGSQDFAVGDWVTYNGSIWERSDYVSAGVLNDLEDVVISGLTAGDILVYNDVSGKWENQPAGFGTVTQENISLIANGDGYFQAAPGGSETVADNPTDTNDFALASGVKTGFTFTPAKTGFLQTLIMGLVDRGLGNGDGFIHAEVYATSGGLPTGAALDTTVSSSYATSNLTAMTNTIVYQNFNFGSDVQLQAGVEYAMLLTCTDTGTIYTRRGNIDESFSQNVTETGVGTGVYTTSPTQETLHYDVIFSNISSQFTLTDDCYISVPPLPDDYHTIQAQTFSINDGQCAYVEIDRAQASPTNLTVIVDDITNVTPDNNKLIFLRVAGGFSYFGLHDLQKIGDAVFTELQVGGGAAQLDDLDDVDLTTNPPVVGDLLQYDGTNWVPRTQQLVDVAGHGVTSWANNTYTTVVYNTINEANGISYSTITGEFTINEDGYYNIQGGLVFNSSSVGVRIMAIYVNGSSTDGRTSASIPGQASSIGIATVNCKIRLTAGDVITLRAYQNSGGLLNTQDVDAINFASIVRIAI